MSIPQKPKFDKMSPEVRVMVALIVLIAFLFVFPLLLLVALDPDAVITLVLPFAVAILAAIFVAVGVAYTRYTASQQATLRVMDEFSSEHLREGRDLIRSLDDKKDASVIATKKDGENFRFFAEYMENLAIGLSHQIYNYQMIKDWLGKDVCFYYDAAEPMIKIYRKNDPDAGPKGQYKNFEALSDHFSNPDNCRAIIPSMSDKNQILLAIIGTGIAIIFGLGGWMSMSISEVRSDIRDIRSDIRDIRADMRENRAIAKADSDKNKDQLAAHLSAHAAPEAPKAE